MEETAAFVAPAAEFRPRRLGGVWQVFLFLIIGAFHIMWY